MEIGQKTRCPVCDSKKAAEPEPQLAAAPASPETPSADFSKEEMEKIDEFVKAHPKDWNDEFDNFFDKHVFAAGYKETVSKCRRRAEIFDAVRELIKDAKTLSADLMIRIMEEIPKKYPEIGDYQARALAKEFFGSRKTIKKLTFKDAAPVIPLIQGFLSDVIGNNRQISLVWNHKKGDTVNVNDILCSLKTCPEDVVAFGLPVPFPSSRTYTYDLRSPWNGKLVSFVTQVQHLDDVICEIEAAD